MPLYESTFIARHDMSTQQVEAITETFTNLIKENGGDVPKTEIWGLKTLAYRIKKNRKGHYVHFNLDAPPAAVQEYERNLRINEDILRYLTVRVDELDPNPTAMMQSRAARDDRSRRGGPPRDRNARPAEPAAASGEAKTETAAKPAPASDTPAPASDAPAPASNAPAADKTASGDDK